jgi:hypothetical protein
MQWASKIQYRYWVFSSIEVTIVSVGQAVELTIFDMFVIVEEIPDIYTESYKLTVLMKQ